MKLSSSGRVHIGREVFNVVNKRTKCSWWPSQMDDWSPRLAMMIDSITPCEVIDTMYGTVVRVLSLDEWKLVKEE